MTFSKVGQYGRLGNQLFQIASTIGLAEKHGYTWRFPPEISKCSAGKLFGLRGDLAKDGTHVPYKELSQSFYDVQFPPTTFEDREPRVTAVDTVHGDSARRGVAARSMVDEAITNDRVVPRAEMGRGRGARDV